MGANVVRDAKPLTIDKSIVYPQNVTSQCSTLLSTGIRFEGITGNDCGLRERSFIENSFNHLFSSFN
jgi:hypothetical protein